MRARGFGVWLVLVAALAPCAMTAETPGPSPAPPPATPVASAATPAPPRTTLIAPGVHLLPGRFVPGSQPDGNSVVLEGRDGLVVVDTGRHAEHADALVAFARAAGKPVRAVVNTHWHLDHVGGNPRLRRAFPGVRVHASGALQEARGGFLAEYRKQLEQLLASTKDAGAQEPLRAELALIDAGDALAPDEVVRAAGAITLAGRDLRLGLETHAVTAGDVWLFDPATRVLVAGDLVTLPVPFLDTACPRRWNDALGRLARQDFAALVPGHGPPLDRAQFEAYRAAFGRLLACAAAPGPEAACTDGWIADAGALIPEPDRPFARQLMAYYVGVLRDPAKAAKLCG